MPDAYVPLSHIYSIYDWRTDMDAAEMRDVLLDIDDKVSEERSEWHPSMNVAGGCAMILNGWSSRRYTDDIDVLDYDRDMNDVLREFPQVNGNVNTYGDQIPYNYEDRLREMPIDTSSVSVLTPSLEDLVVMKLYAWRGKDVDDLTSSGTLACIDWDLLDYLVTSDDEASASVLSDMTYQTLLYRYHEYADMYRR